MKVIFTRSAEMELANSVLYYEQQQSGLGTRFLAEVENAQRRISADPASYAYLWREYRGLALKSFPYSIVYRCRLGIEEVVVIAVAHASRQPGYWQKRLTD